MLWICRIGSHNTEFGEEEKYTLFRSFFLDGGFYHGEFFVQKIGLDRGVVSGGLGFWDGRREAGSCCGENSGRLTEGSPVFRCEKK